MKFCTLVDVSFRPNGELGIKNVVSFSLVGDDHAFGLDDDGFYHLEGEIESVDFSDANRD